MSAMRVEDFEIRKLGKDTCAVIQYKGESEKLVIPGKIGKYVPVSIASSLLKKGNKVRMISLPSTIDEIDDGLFPVLRNLEGFEVEKSSRSFSAEDGVLYDSSRYSLIFYPPARAGSIYDSPVKLGRVARTAFCCKVMLSKFIYHSRLEEFQVLPSECPQLEAFIPGDDAEDYDGVLIKGKKLLFYPPKLDAKAYSIPEGIEEIQAGTVEPFFPPEIKTIYAPASLRKGLERVLCNAEKVDVDSRSAAYRSIDGILYSWKRVLLAYPGKKADEVYMAPSGTDVIGECAFKDSRLRTLILPSGVRAIENRAFEDSDITTLVIPSSVTDIKISAFYGAKKLRKVIVEKGSVAEMFLRGDGHESVLSILPSLF